MEKFLSDKGTHIHTVLEVGSRDVSGNIRDLFVEKDYTGSDMLDGKNVDVVVNGHDLAKHFKGKQFDLVFCFDTLEHDDAFWETIKNIYEVIKPGGWFVVGVPGRKCPLHEYPQDYWRFMDQAVLKVFLRDYEDVYVETQYGDETFSATLNGVEVELDYGDISQKPEDEVYGYGRKPL